MALPIAFFLAEGLGFQSSLFLYAYLCLPAIMALFLLTEKKTLVFPKKISLVFLAYFFLALFSLIYSVDKQNSFELLMFYSSSFLIFVFFHNFKNEGKKLIVLELIIGSIVFSLYFIATLLFPPLKNLQTTGYQLTRSVFGPHNHLGDFLGLTIIYVVFFNRYLLSTLFLPFVILSYSRSAYLSLILTLVVSKKALFMAGLVLFAWFLLLFFQKTPLIDNALKFYHQTGTVNAKDFFSGRSEYFEQIKSAFLEKPLLGYGAGNFGYISNKFNRYPGSWTEVAHNIFVEELIGTGVFGFLIFLLFIFLVLKNSTKNTVFFFLFLYLLVNFQTDYTYRIYSLFVLFMVLSAVVYEERENINEKTSRGVFLILSLVLLIVFHQIIYGRILFSLGRTKASLLAYPLNKSAYPALIRESINNCSRALKYAKLYYYISPGYLPALELLSKLYEGCGDKKTALKMIEEAVENNKFISLPIAKRFYSLKRQWDGKEQADRSFLLVFERYRSVFWQSKIFEDEVREFCRKQNIVGCRFQYFWQPEANSLEHPNPQLSFSKVKNKLNADGLNDRFNYSINKPKDTFRIMVLGGSEAYGQYVETKNNWTELLEDELNKSLSCALYKKVEVINLGMHGYDIAYSIEIFLLKGKKYNPDLIVFLTPSLYIYNEEIQPRMDPTYNWQKAFDKTMSEIGEEKIFTRQKELLKELERYKNKMIFIRDKNFNVREITTIKEVNTKSNIYEEKLENTEEFYYPDEYTLNVQGHKIMAERVFDLFGYNKLCSKP